MVRRIGERHQRRLANPEDRCVGPDRGVAVVSGDGPGLTQQANRLILGRCTGFFAVQFGLEECQCNECIDHHLRVEGTGDHLSEQPLPQRPELVIPDIPNLLGRKRSHQRRRVVSLLGQRSQAQQRTDNGLVSRRQVHHR